MYQLMATDESQMEEVAVLEQLRMLLGEWWLLWCSAEIDEFFLKLANLKTQKIA